MEDRRKFSPPNAALATAILVLIGGAALLVSRRPSEEWLPVPSPSANIPRPEAAHAPRNQALRKVLKDVGEPMYERFGLTDEDFTLISDAGVTAIEGNFDICADAEDVRFFLDRAAAAGLKVILPAGAGEAEWGYPCDDRPALGQKPSWQQDQVGAWVARWKDHPALLLWDISNEGGANFPYGPGGVRSGANWERDFALTLAQLQQAYRDVKKFDPAHEIMIRMNGWYFYDYDENFFRAGNPFGPAVADVVMINAYSNIGEYYSDFVATVLKRAIPAVRAVTPETHVIAALGAWEEPPLWHAPEPETLRHDYEAVLAQGEAIGVAFFKYGAREGSDWWLPDGERGAPELWRILKSF
ncbi:MAG: hypothetical protein A3B37_00195 [Candidatus Sungbacteria bacterium RIFCSPLOWO2_01_FULL_59_16]|uniref:Glycoside hydrolase family 5 domain-containing protein n=1 Tax=Candidatus Sungbacteria bacterium RIFCSPLOWO2_01_FULL_59_16 TaxID=1802280 RepID=A0A1G2LA69_9BACT|nr:MAG: hypothetical protein A3B37_00195 [Candidatus Sungbacteria bacterium RIFCSPLOWO2_01_FULL_59_16]